MILLYLILDHLYDASLFLEGFSSWSRIPPIIKCLNSRSLWSFYGLPTMRKFSEGPALIIGPYQKVQLEVIYFYVVRKNELFSSKIVAYTVKIAKFVVSISNIPCVWNWNCWTLFGSKIKMGRGRRGGGVWHLWPPQWLHPC